MNHLPSLSYGSSKNIITTLVFRMDKSGDYSVSLMGSFGENTF
jgi:hypothetical protein